MQWNHLNIAQWFFWKIKLRAAKVRREDGWENERTPYLVMPTATAFTDYKLLAKDKVVLSVW